MIRTVVALYAIGLMAFPIWGLISPESFRAELVEDFFQAETAAAKDVQIAAAVHWLKNTYLAFAFLLLARFVGKPENVGDVSRAGYLLLAFPLVLVAYDGMSQLALSVDKDDLEISLTIRGSMLLYSVVGLTLVGIAKTISTAMEKESVDQ